MPDIATARIRTYYEQSGGGPQLLYISGTGSRKERRRATIRGGRDD